MERRGYGYTSSIYKAGAFSQGEKLKFIGCFKPYNFTLLGPTAMDVVPSGGYTPTTCGIKCSEIYPDYNYFSVNGTTCVCAEEVPTSLYNNNVSTMNDSCSIISSDGKRCGGPYGAHSIYRNFGAQPLSSTKSSFVNNYGCYRNISHFTQLDNSTSHTVVFAC